MAKLENAVTEGEDGWGFACPVTDGSCAPFTSTGWPTKKLAVERGREHIEDHRGTPMSEVAEFRAKHGVTVNHDGKAVLTAEDFA